MSIRNFVPTIWSARLLEHLHKNLVFMNVVNKDYEGEIRAAGDTVKINQIGNINIENYVGTDITFQDLDSAQTTLVIDKSKYFAFAVDDVDKAQANVNVLDAAMNEAGYAMSNYIDDLLAQEYANAGTTLDNSGSAYSVGNGSSDQNAYDLIVEAAVQLDELNVPEAGRWAILPPWFIGVMLKNEDFKASWQNYMITGQVPVVAGVQIYKSNNIQKSGTTYYPMIGTKQAISYAGQVVNVEALRQEKRFNDAVKGLYVFGYKTVQPKALVTLEVAKA